VARVQWRKAPLAAEECRQQQFLLRVESKVGRSGSKGARWGVCTPPIGPAVREVSVHSRDAVVTSSGAGAAQTPRAAQAGPVRAPGSSRRKFAQSYVQGAACAEGAAPPTWPGASCSCSTIQEYLAAAAAAAAGAGAPAPPSTSPSGPSSTSQAGRASRLRQTRAVCSMTRARSSSRRPRAHSASGQRPPWRALLRDGAGRKGGAGLGLGSNHGQSWSDHDSNPSLLTEREVQVHYQPFPIGWQLHTNYNT
jgi:hypothetical protein